MSICLISEKGQGYRATRNLCIQSIPSVPRTLTKGGEKAKNNFFFAKTFF